MVKVRPTIKIFGITCFLMFCYMGFQYANNNGYLKSQTHFYGKIIGFSKNKKFYIIQWLSTPPHPNNQINVLNQNLRIWSEIGVHYRL